MRKNIALVVAGLALGAGAHELAQGHAPPAYFVHRLVLERPVGSTEVSSGVYAYELVVLPDGGLNPKQVDGVPGFLSAGQQTSANALMDAFTPK